MRKRIALGVSLVLLVAMPVFAGGDGITEERDGNSIVQKGAEEMVRSKPVDKIECDKLYSADDEPYKLIEATLISSGGMLNASSTADYKDKRTKSQQMQEKTSYEALYQNEELGEFSASFSGITKELIQYNKFFHGVERPVHIFCAYEAFPEARTNYIGNIHTLEMVRTE